MCASSFSPRLIASLAKRGAVKAIEVTRTLLGAFDTSGRRRPIDTGEVLIVSCDSVILAVGESVDRDFCRGTGLEITRNGMLEVDRYALTTSRDKVFAGGDFVTGASNVTTAMGWGKDAARNIDHHLMGEVPLRLRHAGFAVRADAAAIEPLRTPPRAFPPRRGPRQDLR